MMVVMVALPVAWAGIIPTRRIGVAGRRIGWSIVGEHGRGRCDAEGDE